MINNSNPCPNRYTMPYIVQPGDTLNSIARRYGINLIGLIELNPNLRLRTLTEGMQICVPKVPERPPCINGSLYVIKEGESFYKLAQRYKVPLNSIIEANPEANPYDLKVGQEICIPNIPAACPFGVIHTVVAGETLSNILIRYNVSINELLDTNPGFNPNILVPGSEICIPPNVYQECRCPNSAEYIVKENDSLATISQAFGITPSVLLIANPNLRPANFIVVGTKVCLPNEAECEAR